MEIRNNVGWKFGVRERKDEIKEKKKEKRKRKERKKKMIRNKTEKRGRWKK